MLEMTDREVDAFLEQQETGTLSLCSDVEAYGVPESFGFLRGTLYFQFGYRDGSRKMSFIESTETVSFTTHTTNSGHDWASAVVRGSLEQIDGEEGRQHATVALGSNTGFPRREVFPGDIDELMLELHQLEPIEKTGRKGPEFELPEPTE